MNSVHLIGLVGCRPRAVGREGDQAFPLLTVADAPGQWVERHRVIVAADSSIDVRNFAAGESVYVEGRIARPGEGRPVAVIATQAWSILPAPAPPADSPGGDTHASPRKHPRRGHTRRIAIGTRRERLIWVRPATVAHGDLNRCPRFEESGTS